MRNLLILIFVLVLFGCPTPYQQKRGFFSNGGYSDFPIGKDSAYISFTGDEHTPREIH
jgi:hypothetical protein